MIKTSTILATSLFASALLATASGAFSQPLPGKNGPDASSQDKTRLERFEKQVDVLRNLLHIPGMSAAVVKNQQVLWAKGFGFADLENRTPVTPETVFHLASITKTFAATLILQLVEQGKLDLDEPMSRYSGDFKDDSVKVKHILSHTSQGTPGERFQFERHGYFVTDRVDHAPGWPVFNKITGLKDGWGK